MKAIRFARTSSDGPGRSDSPGQFLLKQVRNRNDRQPQEESRLGDDELSNDTDDGDAASLSSVKRSEAIESHVGLTEASEQDLAELPRIADKLPASTFLIAFVELAERCSFYGLTGPLQNYMQNSPNDPRGVPGALGLGQSAATGLSYFFQFFCYLTPILGAVVADQYLGKYNTIFIFSLIYLVGVTVLFTTSLPFFISHGLAVGGLLVALPVIGLGTGGIKANVSPLIAEQYTNTTRFVQRLRTGRRVIVDPAVTLQRIFMIYYACINIGSLSSIATTSLEQKVGFWCAFLLPLGTFFTAIFIIVLGRNIFVSRPPQGSVIPDFTRILSIGLRRGSLEAARDNPRWKRSFVDEIRRVLVACQIFLFFPIYWLCYSQMTNNLISQAADMELHGVPNDLLQSSNAITILVFIPILDYIVYPALRRIGIRLLPITRIFCGFLLASMAMAYAALIQHKIYSAPPCYQFPLNDSCMEGSVPNQVHAALQIPAYVFIGLSEIFASITGLEYAYSKAPTNLKSLITSLFLLTNGLGSALGMAISPFAKHPNLVWMYTCLSIAALFAGLLFLLCFHKYNKIDDDVNTIDAVGNDYFPLNENEEAPNFHTPKNL